MTKKKVDPKNIDSMPKLGALAINRLSGVLNSWKKTFRFVLILLSLFVAGAAVKCIMEVLK